MSIINIQLDNTQFRQAYAEPCRRIRKDIGPIWYAWKNPTDNTRNAEIKGDQIEVFKMLNGYANIDSNFFSKLRKIKELEGIRPYFTPMKKQSRLDVRQFSFSQKTINVWKKLSTECVHASSVNMFKNKIDKYLVRACYT